MADQPGAPAAAPPAPITRLRSDQWLALTAGAVLLAALVGVVVSLVALHRLSDARRAVVDRADPARVLSAQYLDAMVNQETGVRGYALSGRREFLAPLAQGRRAEINAQRRLGAIAGTGDLPRLGPDLTRIAQRSDAWHRGYADPLQAAVTRSGASPPDAPSLDQGKVLFDGVRRAVGTLSRNLDAARAGARERLHDSSGAALLAVVLTGVLLLIAVVVAGFTVRRTVALPLRRLARDSRRVARGDFDHEVAVQGPQDIVGVSSDVDAMRRRILEEVAIVDAARERVEEQARDLQRSNAELEQFAYVASHDLQEPLRKVASFCGMLQHRYQGRLDERADQYIAFAVDGARRMQVLINDLLAFSRVGRMGAEHELVDLGDVAAEAVGNLATAIEEAGAAVSVQTPLPRVRGDRSLLVLLLQNLIANGLKFRGDEPPRVRVTAARDGDAYVFGVHDNGIGVAPRYAERIFVIFQRLHTKEEYTGTGIGLAMCRKIVEFHGGEIGLEPEGADGGASFAFTLPVPDEDRARS